MFGHDGEAVHVAAPAVPGGDQRSDNAAAAPGDEKRAGIPIDESGEHLGIVRSRAVGASRDLPQVQDGAELLLSRRPMLSSLSVVNCSYPGYAPGEWRRGTSRCWSSTDKRFGCPTRTRSISRSRAGRSSTSPGTTWTSPRRPSFT